MENLSENLFDFLVKIPKSLYLPIGIAIFGLIFLSIGLIQLSNSHTTKISVENSSVSAPNVQVASTSADTLGLHVDVEGAVASPGVYILPINARVQDALVAAGGLSGTADRDFVAKSLNLAAKIVDGAKVYIPRIGEIPAANASANSYAGSQVHLIDINSASADELDNLPGIGPVTAQKIISGRPYAAVVDLQSKKIISSGVYEKIKDLVTVY